MGERPKQTVEAYEVLHGALSLLSEWCDGAYRRDGMGFNAADSGFGKSLASQDPASWSPKQAAIAWRMARRYRQQLSSAGIDMDAIGRPEEDAFHRRQWVASPEYFTAARQPDGRLRLSSDEFPGHTAVAAVRSIAGRKFSDTKSGGKYWTVPVSSAAQILTAIKTGHIKVADASILAELVEILDRQVGSIEDSMRTSAEIDIPDLGGVLMPFQAAGVIYAIRNLRTFIADEMGLGKTVQALAAILHLGSFPAVIVVPSSLKLNWAKEARKWIKSLGMVAILEGSKPYPLHPRTQLIIVNYDILHGWAETLVKMEPKAIIVDECHYVKSPHARRTIAVRYLAAGRNPHMNKPAEKRLVKGTGKGKPIPVRLLLSGTPVVNAPQDLIPQLQILDRLDDLGGWTGFTDSYCVPGQWGGFDRRGKNLEELNSRMRQGGMFVRRQKVDVLPDLPDKRLVRVPVQLPKKDRTAYDKALAQAKVEIATGQSMAAHLRTIGILRGLTADGKVDTAVEFIQSMVDEGQKVIVFAHYKRVVKAIAAKFECPMIMGETSMKDRDLAVERFQKVDSCRVIVLNLVAGGVGLTLTAASNVVFVESAWTPGGNDQAVDRAHRIGQKDSVTGWFLEAENTIDEWLADLIERKRETVDAATEGDEVTHAAIARELSAMIMGR